MVSVFDGHPIAGWLRRRFGMDSPLAWAQWVACRLLQETGQAAVPIDLTALVLARKARITGFDQHLPCEARLETNSAGFSISLRASLASEENESHRRFAIAHELGHTLFYDLNGAPPERVIHLSLHDPVEEELCDTFAAALLVPPWYLQDVRRELSFEADGLILLDRVCADCRVPRKQAALRLRQGLPEAEHGWLSGTGPRRLGNPS
jgi:hypothetical protein